MQASLSPQDDPDHQMPMPFPAAAQYASQVMAWVREADFSGLQVQRNLKYGEHRLQRYDVFSPQSASNAPILIFWHGGGWTNGYREYVHFMAQHVCALGTVLVAPSYRLAPSHKLPAAYEDALACLAQVSAQAHTFGGKNANEKQRILLSGHSAGGHLAALLKAQDAPVALHELAGQTHFDTHTALAHVSHPWYALLQQHAHAQSPAVPT